jgi:hypothetical protein
MLRLYYDSPLLFDRLGSVVHSEGTAPEIKIILIEWCSGFL